MHSTLILTLLSTPRKGPIREVFRGAMDREVQSGCVVLQAASASTPCSHGMRTTTGGALHRRRRRPRRMPKRSRRPRMRRSAHALLR